MRMRAVVIAIAAMCYCQSRMVVIAIAGVCAIANAWTVAADCAVAMQDAAMHVACPTALLGIVDYVVY